LQGAVTTLYLDTITKLYKLLIPPTPAGSKKADIASAFLSLKTNNWLLQPLRHDFSHIPDNHLAAIRIGSVMQNGQPTTSVFAPVGMVSREALLGESPMNSSLPEICSPRHFIGVLPCRPPSADKCRK